MIAGAVGTIAGSPIPFAPKGLKGSGSSTIFVLTFGTSREVGKIYLAKLPDDVFPLSTQNFPLMLDLQLEQRHLRLVLQLL